MNFVLLHVITSRCVMQYHSCAVQSGSVLCWGLNGNGQVMLFALCFASLMRLHNVELCFTHFGLSQLGDDSTTSRLTPVGVSGLSVGASSISLGVVRPMFGFACG
jgi:hypothetical protein